MNKIIFYDIFGHNGDLLFLKSFLKQFTELNKNNFEIIVLVKYNTFIFSDILDLKIISLSNDNNYITNFSDINIENPVNYINNNNDEFSYYLNFFNQNFPDIVFNKYDNNIFIKTWIGHFSNLTNTIDCDLYNCNNYYNNIIININNKYNLNINIINDLYLLPSIPFSNIDNFINYKNSLINKKIIFYYNYYPRSYPINYNHDDCINILATKFNNYIICCAFKSNIIRNNIISLDDFGYTKNISCDNIAKAIYCAMLCDYVISIDTGACFYMLNDKFNKIFKGKWIHISNKKFYYNNLNKYLNNNYYIYLNDISHLINFNELIN